MSGCAGAVMNAQHKEIAGKKRVHGKFERTLTTRVTRRESECADPVSPK